jgi:hypothetical protein
MSRNIDIIAITLLLAGMAVCAEARNVMIKCQVTRGFGYAQYARTVVAPPPMPPPPFSHFKVMRD